MSEPTAPEEESGPRTPISARQTVLVVDDVEYLRELATLFLARTARTVTASDGIAGLAVARRERPALILCDHRMPGMDGADFCREIRGDAVLASTPFVMLVSGAGGSERKLAIRAGADDVLAKPLSRASLISAVARHLSTSRVCGLPRIDLAVPVTLTVADRDERGVVRNLSRGGLFVETGCKLSADEEVGLRFRLPGSSSLLAPSAFVVWCSEGGHRVAAGSLSQRPVRGVGLRFLQIDSPSVRTLEDFVYTQGGPLQ